MNAINIYETGEMQIIFFFLSLQILTFDLTFLDQSDFPSFSQCKSSVKSNGIAFLVVSVCKARGSRSCHRSYSVYLTRFGCSPEYLRYLLSLLAEPEY